MDFIKNSAVSFPPITTLMQKNDDTGVGVKTRVPSNLFSFFSGIPASVTGQISMRLADGTLRQYSIDFQVSLAPAKATAMNGVTISSVGGVATTSAPTINVTSLAEAQKSWTDMNPGYEVRYFSLNMAREYLQKHFHFAFLRTFDCIESFSGKSDFFWAALLYREGGFHSDFKQKLLRPNLLEEIADLTDFFASKY